MLSLAMSAKERRELSETLGELSSRYEKAFEEGLVHVFYSFDGKRLTYIAYWGEEYGKCVFPVEGKRIFDGTRLSAALALYIYERDKNGTPEELSLLYGNDYRVLNTYASLGPKKTRTLLEASRKIDDLVLRLDTQDRYDRGRKPKLEFVIEADDKDASISFRLGFGKLYMNRKVISFLRDYYAGEMLYIQKEHVFLPPHSFSEQEEKAFQFLYNEATSHYSYNRYYYDTTPVYLEEGPFMDFLFLLSGMKVEFNGTSRIILPPIDVRLKVGADGLLEAEPEDIPENLAQSKGKGYAINNGEVQLYRFASAKAGEVYSFYQRIGGLDGDLIADELARKVFPLLGQEELSLDEGFTEKHPVLRPEIHFYVGLEENKALSFKTQYFLGHEELGRDAFVAFSQSTAQRQGAFLEEIGKLGLMEEGTQKGDEAIISFLAADLSSLHSLATIFVSEELQSRHVEAIPDFNLRTTSGEDWFSLEFYTSGYSQEELLQIYSAFHRKKKFVRLSNTYVLLDHNADQLRRISESFAPDQIGVELPLYQALKLPDLGGETDDHIRALMDKVSAYSALDLPPFPAEIESFIRPYQRQGIRFLANLYRLGLSGILSDDMGLGKTLQSFGLISLIEEKRPMLIVCPKSLIYNWLEERNKWYPDLPAYVLSGAPKDRKALYARMKKKEKACYFVSYDTLRNDISLVKGIEFSLLLLDEGQYIANANAQKTRAVKEIKATSRFVLTGTPIQNSLMDLWSIFDFLLPGYFPPLLRFKELYGSLEFSSDESRQRLMAKISPFLLGRKKKDVLTELPDKENITMALAMNEEQRKTYESFLAKTREVLEDENADKISLLSMMTRLRQICITPSLFLEGDFASSKIDYLVDSLSELKRGGRKAIVFSSFVGALDLIRKRCEEAGLESESITGQTSAKVRVILAERFNKPDSPIDVMLVSLKAGGTGLNLIGADTVFHLDPWWNLAAEHQAEDRAHRIGQTNKVTVFKLVMKDSIEEKVVSLQEKKGLLLDMADEASLERALTEEDYRYLLS